MSKGDKIKTSAGTITIGKIRNKQYVASGKKESGAAFIAMSQSNTRFVHYPDCQQLLIWLTQPGREYGNLRLRNRKTKKIVEEWPVTDKLNGSIQICWDTLAIAPGTYTIEIDWKNGWRHLIDIEKHREDAIPAKKKLMFLLKKQKSKKHRRLFNTAMALEI